MEAKSGNLSRNGLQTMRNVSIHARTTQRAYWSTIAGPFSPSRKWMIRRFNNFDNNYRSDVKCLYDVYMMFIWLTSGKSCFSDMMKTVVVLAVPGVVICIVNRRWSAVLVKNPSIIIQLNERVYRAKYSVKASKFLFEFFMWFSESEWYYLTRLAITFFVLHSRRSCRLLLTRSRQQEKSVNVSTPSCKGYSSIFNEAWKNKTKCIDNIKVFELKILNMVYRKTMLILPPNRLELLE